MKYKFETKTIGDCCDIIKKSIHPEKGQVYTCFSLPAFDNSNTPEILNGEEIKSSKFVLDENTILFNKLNPKFRRVWNIHSLEKYENTICSTEFLPLKAKANIEQDYLYYYVSSPYFTRLMDGIRTGTSNSQQRIDWKQFLREPINVPSLPIQRKVVSLLRNIDKKIELNNTINNNLEQQVTTVFYNMFGKYEQNSNTHKPLSTIAKFKYGTMPKKDKLGTGHYHAFSGYQIVGTYPEVMFENPQLIIVARGVGGCGDVKYTPANCYLTNLSIAIITEKTMYDNYLYHYLRLHDTKIMNTGSAQPQITVATLEKFEIPIPPEEEMIRFSDFVQPFKQQYRNNQDENKLLSKLRDTLLPKLMSGELDISDIDL